MLNHITLMGRLTRAPELRRTQSGTAVTSFSLAVDRRADRDGNRQTDFFDFVAWRGTAEFINKNFSKGQMAVVEGSLHNRDWEDKNGNKRRSNEILVENIFFASPKPAAKESAAPSDPEQPEYGESDEPAEAPEYDDEGELPY